MLFNKSSENHVKQRVETLENDIAMLKKRVTELELEQEAFRNKVLRKVQRSSGDLGFRTNMDRLK